LLRIKGALKMGIARKEYEQNLRSWLVEALKAHSGSASIVEVCKYVWDNHENELKKHGDRFYTWQYDIRWVADKLRNEGVMSGDLSPRGIWKLVSAP
jgi:hypothetical protein